MHWIIALLLLLPYIQAAEYQPLYRLPGGCQLLNDHLISTTRGVYALDSGAELLTDVYVQTLSPDGRSVLADDTVYDLVRGEAVLQPGTASTFYSADGAYFVVYGDAVYDTATWEPVYDLTDVMGRVLFSPDGAYIAAGDDALYATASGERVLDIATDANTPPQFAGRYFIDPAAGVYDLFRSTWAFRVDTQDGRGAIHRGGLAQAILSPDETLLYVPGYGLYDTATWALVLSVTGNSGARAAFSADSTRLAVDRAGVFDIGAGTRLLAGDNRYRFSPDGVLLAAFDEDFNTIVYDAATMEPRFEARLTSAPVFSPDRPDGTLLLSGAMYDAQSGDILYSDAPRFGRFSPDGALLIVDFVGVYTARTGEPLLNSVYTLINDDASIVATTEADACMVWGRR